MSRRSLLPFLAVAVALLVPSAPAAAPGPPEGSGGGRRTASAQASRSWAQNEIRAVVARGLMSQTVASFRPNDALTRSELTTLVAGLTRRPARVAPDPTPVTIAQLDAALVRGLGLAGAAASFTAGARRAGLAPPARFGNEVVARLLGLRPNHPAKRDDLELLPSDEATRAEAAYSAARILAFRGWEVAGVKQAAQTFDLGRPTAWQRRVLATAVRLIGFPYVWGGTSERSQTLFGIRSRGGFDCSGFIWRVFKLHAYPGGAALAQTLRGRTTFALSAEVERARRVPFARLLPADLVFFGSAGPRSKPAAVDHAGIYLGGGWIIHSSRQGVALSPLSGWYRERFAWARRPLAEARLEPPR